MAPAKRKLTVLLAAAAALVAVALVGSAAAKDKRASSGVEIKTAKVAKLGTVLVDGTGHVLYMFQPYDGGDVVCNAQCQRIWPPVVAPNRGAARAIEGAKQSLIGSARNPVDGKRIVTYAGLPLYTYILDTKRHQANGQDVALNGGYWWVLTPAGKINRTRVSHGNFDNDD